MIIEDYLNMLFDAFIAVCIFGLGFFIGTYF